MEENIKISTQETVCAVVVTFNRKELLLECLDAIKNQSRPVDGICIIDNASEDGTPELLLQCGFIPEIPTSTSDKQWETMTEIRDYKYGKFIKVIYVRMNENKGGAGGFNEGIKRAYKEGFDWFWLMDDDIEPKEYALERQLKYSNISLCIHPSKEYIDGELFSLEGLVDLGSGFIYQFNEERFRYEKEWTSINFGCFEGMLIHRSIVDRIGFPKPDMFLIGDDTIYGYYASFYTNVIYIRDSCFVKKIKPQKNVTLLWHYLSLRNNIYVAKKMSNDKYRFALLSIAFLFYRLLKGLLNIDGFYCKLIAIFLSFLAFYDGIYEKFGKEKFIRKIKC